MFRSTCQDIKLNLASLVNLKEELKSRKDIQEVKLYESKYFMGNVKYQGLLVKYNEDPEKRYWMVGKGFRYYKNGRIKVWQNFDLVNNTPIDTGYSYYKNGNIKQMFINQNNSSYTQLPEKVFLKNIWFNNPAKYKINTYWENGIIKNEYVWKFLNGKYEFDGIFTTYDAKGNLLLEEEFQNGKKVKK
jgi:hypothetical protein